MKIIAVRERSAGNESVGSMWLETKSFDPSTPVGEIIEWGNRVAGDVHDLQRNPRDRLMLTVEDGSND